jgi:hypothetical protein
MRRLVVLVVLFSAASVGTAGVAAGAAPGGRVQAGVPRVVPAKKHKSKPKTVSFTVSGAFQGKAFNGKAPSNTVRCYPSGTFFNGMWQGTVSGTQFSINFQTRTGATATATGTNTASLIVNNDQQNGLGAPDPTITLTSTQKSGAFDGQFVEAGSSANSIRVKGPFRCAAQ